MEQSFCPGAWLSLDEGDNELFVFIGYFVAAIQTVFPNFGAQISALTQNVTGPSLPTVSNYLLYEIDQIEQDFVLVLDDFQAITNTDIHEILWGFFRYPLPHFHLVLVSRHKPPLQILKLQAQSRLGELRANDLRFSETEVAAFAEKALPFLPDAATIKSLAEKTEGWPVGLRLATIAIRRWGLDEHQPAVLQVDNQYIVEYLINEVLVRQAASIRMLLLKTSILDRFTAPLCAAILNSEAVEQKILLQLEREGMFIESLDNRREWFRYHQLFRELLYEQLTE
ncbi:MAG: hypothetical protein KC441_13855, partial [Anaerolineales bacterium]|nr:hypothetical protein [Anaerolineales bacterium]